MHDPLKVADNLRNHLAVHDSPLSFLFGAGTSCAINVAPPPAPGVKPEWQPLVPSIGPLTKLCAAAVAELGKEYEEAWRLLAEECVAAEAAVNVENVLSRVRVKIDALGPTDKLLGLAKDELVAIEGNIRRTIAHAATPCDSLIPSNCPHDRFAVWLRNATRSAPVEIFTTNYDLLFERALENAGIPLFDGFVGAREPFFHPDIVERDELMPPSSWVRLWKLHGSVNWVLASGAGRPRVIRTQPTETGEMILPSHRKYDESQKQPFRALQDRLAAVLNTEHSLLTTCGYSFSDQHINAVIFGVLDTRHTAHVNALMYDTLAKDSHLALAAVARPNLTVIGPNAAVMSGKWAEWRLEQPIDEKTCGFMDYAFDSMGAPEDELDAVTKLSRCGTMRLGDFSWFTHFLNTMTPS